MYKIGDTVNYKLNGEIVKCEVGMVAGEIIGIRPLEGKNKDTPVIATLDQVFDYNKKN